MRLKLLLLFVLTVGIAASIPSLPAADAPATFKVGEFTFARPASWEWLPSTSSMRAAQLKVPGTGKDSAEVVFFFFGAGGGGGTQANIDRWLGQFKEPKEQLKSKTDSTTVSNRKVTFVQAEGTYLSGMPGAPKVPQANTMLLGAILESDEGNVFIRLTGPVKLAQEAQPQFRKMVEGAKVSN